MNSLPCEMLQDNLQSGSAVVQASQTTAQGLWLAGVCGVIVGVAIWFGGPFAVAGNSCDAVCIFARVVSPLPYLYAAQQTAHVYSIRLSSHTTCPATKAEGAGAGHT